MDIIESNGSLNITIHSNKAINSAGEIVEALNKGHFPDNQLRAIFNNKTGDLLGVQQWHAGQMEKGAYISQLRSQGQIAEVGYLETEAAYEGLKVGLNVAVASYGSYALLRGGSGTNVTATTGRGTTYASTHSLLDDPLELDLFLNNGADGWAFYREVQTSKGVVEIKSKVYSVDNMSLLIDDVHVFPKNTEKLSIGFREVKTIFQLVADEMGGVGFNNVMFRGQRISGAKFINNATNKTQSFTFTPKKPNQP